MKAGRKVHPAPTAKPELPSQSVLARLLHELRSPLNAVIGYAELAADESARLKAERLSEHLKDLLLGARQLQAVIETASGHDPREEGPHSIAAIMDEAARLAAPHAVRRSVRLQPAIASPDIAVGGDKGKILQILGNLLENAVKFSPPGGRVGLEAHFETDRVALSVWDEGPGIAEEELCSIFEPGVRGAAGRRTAGHGLGLAIARDLARTLGGSLEAERGREVGAGFTLLLPRVRG